MKRCSTLYHYVIVLALILLGGAAATYAQKRVDPKSRNKDEARLEAQRWMGREGVRFTENRGQIVDTKGELRPDILYTASAGGVNVYFAKNRVSYVFTKVHGSISEWVKNDGMSHDGHATPPTVERYRMDMELIGANPAAAISASEQMDGLDNYYLAHCPDGVTGVRSFSKLLYRDIYPDIDMVLRSTERGSKCEFIVRPGGRVADIRMRYVASGSVAIARAGGLAVTSPLGYLEEDAPYSYQGAGGAYVGRAVASRYRITDGVVGFEVPSYDRSTVLVIDPTQQWATYFGGTNTENLGGGDPTEVDRAGNVMIAGYTKSTQFVASPGADQELNQGPFGSSSSGDAFVVKFSGAGNRLWATYFGGNDDEIAHGVSSDPDGNVFITGHTESIDNGLGVATLPVRNAFQAHNGWYLEQFNRHLRDAFVAKFDSNGVRLWATYYGGVKWDDGYGFAVDSNHNVAVLVTAGSAGLGTPGAYRPTKPSGAGNNEADRDLLLVKFDPSGARIWANYFGGSKLEYGYAAASDINDNIIITGWTGGGFPVFGADGFPPAQSTFGGVYDAFVAAFRSDGWIKWSTYYGGTATENRDFGAGNTGYCGVATDATGNVFIAGSTTGNVPTLRARWPVSLGGWDAFVVKYDTNGVMQWGTHFGGSGNDVGVGVASNQLGGALITGFTTSGDLPTTQSPQLPFQTIKGSGTDAFIAKFDRNGVPRWMTYFGAGGIDEGQGISYDPYGSIIIAGHTNTSSGAPFSRATPVPDPGQINNPWQPANNGGYDAFISLFCDPEPPVIDSSGPTTFCPDGSLKLWVMEGFKEVRWFTLSSASPLQSDDTLNITQSGRYFVRVTNASGCVAFSDTINVVKLERNQPVLTSDSTFCDGDSVRLTVGPETYARYAWLRGADTVGRFQELWTKTPGLHKLYTIDEHGCSDSMQVTVIRYPKPAPLTILPAGDTIVTCEDVPVTLTASGGAPGVITWMPKNVAQPSISLSKESETGLYYAISRTPAGCFIVSDSIYVRVIRRPQFEILFNPQITFCDGDSVVLTASKVFARYKWSTGAKDTNRSVVVKESGTITLEVANEFDCKSSKQITVQKIPRPAPRLAALGDTVFCEGGSVTLTSTPGYLGYQWSTGDAGSTLVVRQSGRYWVQASNGPGCTGVSDTITVTVRPKPDGNLTGPSEVCINAGATYSVDSVPGYSYRWSVTGAGGSLTSSDTGSAIMVKWGPGGEGTVSVTITDDVTRCSTTQTLPVSVGNALVPTIGKSRSPILCPGDTITLDAGDGYVSYLWSTGDTTRRIIATLPGRYTVKVVDGGGCSGTSQPIDVTINQAPAPKITASTLALCPGDSAVLDAGPGYSRYRWMDGRSIQKLVVRTAGTFQVTVTDTNGCTGVTDPVTIVMNTPPTPVIDGPNSVCINASEVYQVADPGTGNNDSFIWKVTGGTITSGGGTGRIIVQWPTAGPGTVEVTERSGSTGCIGLATPYAITVGTTIVPQMTSNRSLAICDGDSVVISAPSGYATYAWFGSGWSDSVRNQPSITVSRAGVYSVYVTTNGGCSGANSVEVTQKAPVVPTIEPNGVISICEGDSARLTAVAGFVRYLWSTGDTTRSIMVRVSGEYSVLVADEDNCTGMSQTVKVVVNPNPATPAITAEGDSLMAPLASAYEWSYNGSVMPGGSTRTIFAPLSGAYVVKITDANGCSAISAPYTTVAATSATVRLPDNTAEPGERIEVPFELVASQGLERNHVARFTAKLRFRRTLLMPLDQGMGTTYDPVTGDRIMNLAGTHDGASGNGQLLLLRFQALLGDTTGTPMTIDEFQWIDSSGAPVSADINVINGSFTLENLCLTGNTRLVNGSGQAGFKAVLPNPTNGLTQIEYEVVENGRTQIYLIDPLGTRVATVLDADLAPGVYLATFDASGLPSGSYFCVLQTPTQRLNRTMQVTK